jgi:hypothetical protein
MFTATRNISSKINQGTPKITTVLLNQEMAKYKALPQMLKSDQQHSLASSST